MEVYVSWWAPRSSKPVRPSSSVWRVRFPSASATVPPRRCLEPVESSGPVEDLASDSEGAGALGSAPPGGRDSDPRRRIPRTDHLLEHPRVTAAGAALGPQVLRGIIRAVQDRARRSEEHTSELQSRGHLVCRLLLEKKKKNHVE